MTVRVTVTAWFKSRQPEGWDHDQPEAHAFADRREAEAFVAAVQESLDRVNALRERRGRPTVRTTFDLEETA